MQSSAETSTTTQAIVKACPALGFLDIQLLEDLKAYGFAIETVTDKGELVSKVAEASSAKKLIENMCMACKGAVNDLFAARANERKAKSDREKAEKKRQKDLEAARSGEHVEKKRKEGKLLGILNFEVEGSRPQIAKYSEQELQKILVSGDQATITDLFSKPFIVTNVGFLIRMSPGMQGQAQRFKSSFVTEKSRGTLRGQLLLSDDTVAESLLYDVASVALSC